MMTRTILAITKFSILFDSGASANIVFVDTLRSLPANVSVCGTFQSRKAYRASAVFGASTLWGQNFIQPFIQKPFHEYSFRF